MMSHSITPPRSNRIIYGALAIVAFAIVSGAVFAAWIDNGPKILMTLGNSALAWCF